MTVPYDFTIVGGGIIGLSTGMALVQRFPEARLLILEKESVWTYHQTGHNSGVIHSGIYYRPGSLKAKLSRLGNRLMIEFCSKNGIDYDVCGKVIVATEKEELPLLEALYQRGIQNGLKAKKLCNDELEEVEPHVKGLASIQVPTTAIVDFGQVAEAFVRLIGERQGDLRLNTKVENILDNGKGVTIETTKETFHTKVLINCAGLQSDRLARVSGVKTDVRIIPFRGEYYKLKPEKRYLVKHLIYPVPNPNFPFLGVHFTRMIDGEIYAGPNAVLSLKREGYRKSDFDLRDIFDVLSYPAFWKLARRYYSEGIKEMIRSWSKVAFVRNLKRLIPEIHEDDIVPARAGVRAQALTKGGNLVDDFLIVEGRRSFHVCNAPSPAATASIPIGEAIVEQIIRKNPL